MGNDVESIIRNKEGEAIHEVEGVKYKITVEWREDIGGLTVSIFNSNEFSNDFLGSFFVIAPHSSDVDYVLKALNEKFANTSERGLVAFGQKLTEKAKQHAKNLDDGHEPKPKLGDRIDRFFNRNKPGKEGRE